MRHYREMGTVQPKPHGGGAVAKLGKEQLPIVKALVTAQPDALLKELCERFAGQTGVGVELTKSGSHPPDSSAKPDVNR
jgi:transposase